MNFDTSEFKVTYLLGAGASAKALPTVKDFSKSLDNFIIEIQSSGFDQYYTSFIEEIIVDLKEIAKETKNFGTPDTFAKYLYLKDKDKLIKLKNALSFYFTVEQFINNKIDNRALIFLTTVMQLEVFPTNIKILTWNYDFQIQLAAETYKSEEFHLGLSKKHQLPLIDYYPSLGNEFHVNNNDKKIMPSMIHLNGIAGFYYDRTNQHILNNFLNVRPKNINELVDKIITQKDTKANLLGFAWETNTDSAHILRMRLELAQKMILDTDILVVIGYSFPFFNRAIDKKIFEILLFNEKLAKIIYQDPINDGSFLRRQFNLPNSIEIIHIKSTDNYYVPHEL